jgi:hypothetical protein
MPLYEIHYMHKGRVCTVALEAPDRMDAILHIASIGETGCLLGPALLPPPLHQRLAALTPHATRAGLIVACALLGWMFGTTLAAWLL